MAKQWKIPNRIREYRERAGKTQMEVAESLGTSVGAYQNIEYGDREPGSTLGIRLAQWYVDYKGSQFRSKAQREAM